MVIISELLSIKNKFGKKTLQSEKPNIITILKSLIIYGLLLKYLFSLKIDAFIKLKSNIGSRYFHRFVTDFVSIIYNLKKGYYSNCA
ncbi:hypothetical protein B0178_11645 [Streptococcus pseudopneumoniae]|nr:hypothetical protein U753_10220 [Streptococcus pseudopneumoniae 5247]OOR79015.1 hypothetical protein B0177_11055 [Streptococcus pseudopneumoniae]OOR79145.1 hypothetical protein B0178_11645 [Streptococcus pseudopneumoniae]ORC36670.1 hypothetical protein B4W83_10975 [Streptococcus pseudopneumoniae ATCC BAA-960 = CCUG 49455]